MKTKFIPAVVMLLGGAVACIVTFLNNYSLDEMLSVLIISLIIFLILGVVIRLIIDSFELPDENRVDDEGEVVEKQGDNTEEGEESFEGKDSESVNNQDT